MSVRHFRVPVLTEEYAIHIYIGPLPAVKVAAEQRLKAYGLNIKLCGTLNGLRGIAWDCLPEHNPIIAVRDDLSPDDARATLAHEASHAVGTICAAIDLDDAKGEFRAHAISAVMRMVGPKIRRRRGR